MLDTRHPRPGYELADLKSAWAVLNCSGVVSLRIQTPGEPEVEWWYLPDPESRGDRFEDLAAYTESLLDAVGAAQLRTVRMGALRFSVEVAPEKELETPVVACKLWEACDGK